MTTVRPLVVADLLVTPMDSPALSDEMARISTTLRQVSSGHLGG